MEGIGEDSAMKLARKEGSRKKVWSGNHGVKWAESVSKSWKSKHSSRAQKTLAKNLFVAPEELKNVKRLGEGAYAVVDLCIYSSAKGQLCPVAVKRLKPNVFKNQTDLHCFLNESKLMRKMRHPCIVDFFGVGVTDTAALESQKDDGKTAQERVYLVQEFMNKGTLKNMVQKQMCTTRKKVYSNTQALKWALQIARGLKYLHKAKPKLIHRDVKMENVMLKENDDGEVVAKLGDFGLCAMIDKGGTRIDCVEDINSAGWSLASHFSMCSTQDDVLTDMYELSGKTGSLMYMAPEVLRFESYNEKCDIFSFGVILYELFTRATLLTFVSCNGDPSEVEGYAWSVASGHRPQIPNSLPEQLSKLLQRCWAGNMNDRPSASQLVRELDDMLHDEDMLMDMESVRGCNCCGIQ